MAADGIFIWGQLTPLGFQSLCSCKLMCMQHACSSLYVAFCAYVVGTRLVKTYFLWMYCSSVSRPYLLVVAGQVCHLVMGNKNGHESWLQIVRLSIVVLGPTRTNEDSWLWSSISVARESDVLIPKSKEWFSGVFDVNFYHKYQQRISRTTKPTRSLSR